MEHPITWIVLAVYAVAGAVLFVVNRWLGRENLPM
jgi:hypothetical protein